MTDTLRVDRAVTVEELLDYLNEIVELHSDHHPSTIYINAARGFGVKLYLEEETLTDGSKTLNLEIRQRD